MIYIITSLISIVMGVVATLIFIKAGCSISNINESTIFNFLTMFFTSLLVVAAYLALKTWKYQINHHYIYSEVSKLEKSIIRFLVISSSESDFNKDDELIQINNTVISSMFSITQRNFSKDILESLRNNFRTALSEIKEDNFVSKETHKLLLKSLNELSAEIYKKFN